MFSLMAGRSSTLVSAAQQLDSVGVFAAIEAAGRLGVEEASQALREAAGAREEDGEEETVKIITLLLDQGAQVSSGFLPKQQ